MPFFVINFITLCRLYLYALWRGRARRAPQHLRRFLILQPAKLGDMVCITPMCAALKRQYPQCIVAVGGNALNKQLLADHPLVDEYIVLEKTSGKNVEQFVKGSFDAAFLVTPSFDMVAALFCARIPLISAPYVVDGWSPYQTKAYRLATFLFRTAPHHMGQYAPREYLRLLETVGIVTDDTTKTLAYSSEADKKISSLLSTFTTEDFLVGVAPGVGNKIKRWDPVNFAEVAKHLFSRYGAKILIIGGPADTSEVSVMRDALASTVPYLDVSGTLSIDELKAVIQRLHLFVGVDTGPLYIAEAFQIPTVAVIGPVDEREQPPRGKRHEVVYLADRKKAEVHIMNARVYNKQEARRQIDDITVAMVTSKIDDLIVRINKK